MRRHWVLLAALACLTPGVLLGGARAARADRSYERIVLDHVELEPSTVRELARMRLYVNAIGLLQGGAVLKIPPKGWQLKIGSSDRRVPFATGIFSGTESQAAVVFLIETSGDFREAMAAARKQIVDLVLPALPADTLVGVAGFSDEAPSSIKLGPLKTAAARLDELAPAGTAAPDLVSAVDAAVRALRRVKTKPEGRPLRRLIVLVSDGRTATPDRDTVTELGTRAGRAGIRIDTIGYAPPDGSKGPLLNLGELSRQSMGTFRWIRLMSGNGWSEHLGKLAEEIGHQYVLTLLVPAEDFAGKQVSVTAEISADHSVTSNRLRVPQPLCGRDECPGDGYCVDAVCVARRTGGGLGVLGWIFSILGAIAGVAAVGGAGFVVVQKLRARKGAPRPAPAGVPGPAGAPAAGAPAHGAAPAGAAIQPLGAGYRPAAAQPTLYVLSGPRTGQRIPLHNEFLIGKAPGCHLVLDQDGFASSQHATIQMDALGNCTLIDRGSTNGTYINGIRVTQMALTHGMAVRVGSTELRFLAQ